MSFIEMHTESVFQVTVRNIRCVLKIGRHQTHDGIGTTALWGPWDASPSPQTLEIVGTECLSNWLSYFTRHWGKLIVFLPDELKEQRETAGEAAGETGTEQQWETGKGSWRKRKAIDIHST